MIKHWQVARDLLLQGQDVIYSEGGNSMLPLIKSREPVTLAPCNPDLLEKGDIVLVRVRRATYTHLVKGVRGQQVLIGNNQGRLNGWTSKSSVYGIVVAINGRPIANAQSKRRSV